MRSDEGRMPSLGLPLNEPILESNETIRYDSGTGEGSAHVKKTAFNTLQGPLPHLLATGRVRELLAETVDSPGYRPRPEDVVPVVGGLVFAGRISEAETFAGAHGALCAQPGNDQETAAAIDFYLGLGKARLSLYEDARQHFARNLRRARASLRTTSATPTLLFYVWQGLAFFRFLACRFASGLQAAQKACQEALLTEDFFHRVLATDVKGHCLVKLGEISSGLRTLQEAKTYAERLGNGGIVQTIRVSLLIHEAGHDPFPQRNIEKLEAFRATLEPEDCYTIASMDLEIARQHTLHGNADAAHARLAAAEADVFSHGHRRQKASLWQARAHLRLLAGKPAEALAMLDSAESCLHAGVDLSSQLQIDGLRERCYQEQGECVPIDVSQRVAKLGALTGSGISRLLEGRRKGHFLADRTDDKLAVALDKAAMLGSLPQTCVAHLVDFGLLFRLPSFLDLPLGARALVVDLLPGGLVVLDEGNVICERGGFATQLKAFCLLFLRQSRVSKKDCVEALWGYRYAADRHDSLVYALVNRLRRLLGTRADWLRHEAGSYHLAPGVLLHVHDPWRERLGDMPVPKTREGTGLTPVALEPPGPIEPHTHKPPSFEGTLELNHRQRLVLEWLRNERFLAVPALCERYNVSRITAVRDLDGLLARGLVVRVGKARATHYTLR